ncbi:hypothetical protein KSP24_07875 [Paenibacillus sp. AK121]|uniref:hypothetical protein n=1 Tax=Paenibacillus TaxID=44249 RepID=UPI0007EB5D46|nr:MULTISPECIES: hypothetical protein [Paenibacillus]MBU9706845.1 hypothetical protein [Paenibacillus sp. AK121]MEE4567131.1 hypothetical protein [Paenibacillus polymyxa]OAZ48473.1 hypothetical protein A9Z39_14910 [Paenibacillus polymyxa]
MRKFQKISFSTFASLMMILTPIQAAFADEAVTNNPPPAQELQDIGNIELQGIEWGTIGDSTKDIYMTGDIKIVVNASSIQSFPVYAVDPNGGEKFLGQIKGKEYIKTQLYGYYKIYVGGNKNDGSFYVYY